MEGYQRPASAEIRTARYEVKSVSTSRRNKLYYGVTEYPIFPASDPRFPSVAVESPRSVAPRRAAPRLEGCNLETRKITLRFIGRGSMRDRAIKSDFLRYTVQTYTALLIGGHRANFITTL